MASGVIGCRPPRRSGFQNEPPSTEARLFRLPPLRDRLAQVTNLIGSGLWSSSRDQRRRPSVHFGKTLIRSATTSHRRSLVSRFPLEERRKPASCRVLGPLSPAVEAVSAGLEDYSGRPSLSTKGDPRDEARL